MRPGSAGRNFERPTSDTIRPGPCPRPEATRTLAVSPTGCQDGGMLAIANLPASGGGGGGGGTTDSDDLQVVREAELLDWVERHHTQQGAQFSMLFSDIDPGYYARWGYRACPSWNGCWRTQSAEDLPMIDGWQVEEFDPAACREDVMRCYSSWQQSVPVSVERDVDYWGYLTGKAQGDCWVWFIDDGGRKRGYAVYARRGQKTLLRELCADPGDSELTRLLLRRLADELQPQQAMGLQGWVPRTDPFLGLFEIAPRTVEITMIKWCGLETRLPPGLLEAAQCLQELDHV